MTYSPQTLDIAAEAEAAGRRLHERGVWVSADLRVTAETAAELLYVAEKTLANWRAQAHPLPYVRGPRVTYRLVDLLTYLHSGDAAA